MIATSGGLISGGNTDAGDRLALDLDAGFWAQITDSNGLGAYEWQRMIVTADGNFIADPFYMVGTFADNPAYELNLNPNVPIGSIVRLYSGTRAAPDFRFLYNETSSNVTTGHAIRWGWAQFTLPEDNGLPIAERVIWSGQLLTWDHTINSWICKEQVWLLVISPTQNPVGDLAEQCYVAMQRPMLIRSEDRNYSLNNETRPLYSYTVGDEMVQAIATSNGTTVSWSEVRPDGNPNLGLSGSILNSTGAVSFTGEYIRTDDLGLVRRGFSPTNGQALINSNQSQAANGTVQQIDEIWQQGTFALLSGYFQLTIEGSGTMSPPIAFNANAGDMQTALDHYLGAGWGNVTGNGTITDRWRLTYADTVTHPRLWGNPFGLFDFSSFVWIPLKSAEENFYNVTLNGTLTLNNTTIVGFTQITINNVTFNTPFTPNDFVGWGEITDSNLSTSGWVYAWQVAKPADINQFAHYGSGGTFNNGTLWERNNYEIPIGEHVRVYLGERTNGTISVTKQDTYTWNAEVIAGGGTFTIAADNGTVAATTAPIPFGASAAAVQTALNALSVIDNANVTGNGTQASPYVMAMDPLDNIANMSGYGSLTYNQNYVCEYEKPGDGSNVTPGAPNFSIQYNDTGFKGSANLTFNTTSQRLKVGSGFTATTLLGLDGQKEHVSINPISSDLTLINNNLSTNGANQTFTLLANVTCVGNGTMNQTFYNLTFVNGSLKSWS